VQVVSAKVTLELIAPIVSHTGEEVVVAELEHEFSLHVALGQAVLRDGLAGVLLGAEPAAAALHLQFNLHAAEQVAIRVLVCQAVLGGVDGGGAGHTLVIRYFLHEEEIEWLLLLGQDVHTLFPALLRLLGLLEFVAA